MNKRKIAFMGLLLMATLHASAQAMASTMLTTAQSSIEPDALPTKAPVTQQDGEIAGIAGSAPMSGIQPTTDLHHQVVLLIGDSMVGRLAPRFNDYAEKNGFEFHSEVWNGSTTRDWAIASDLQYQIERVHPTYIIISLGTNDLGYRDYERRTEAINTILSRVGDIPYTWIGPLAVPRYPNREIVNLIETQTGSGRFFDSTNIPARRIDGIHPTFQAASEWVDAVVQWLSQSSFAANPLPLECPDYSTNYHPDEYHNFGYHGRRE